LPLSGGTILGVESSGGGFSSSSSSRVRVGGGAAGAVVGMGNVLGMHSK
jgi:hypothetical protein